MNDDRTELDKVEAQLVALIAEYEAHLAKMSTMLDAHERQIDEISAQNDAIQLELALMADRRGEKPH